MFYCDVNIPEVKLTTLFDDKQKTDVNTFRLDHFNYLI